MIAIIDYGVGNLRSVEKAFQYIGSKAVVTSDIKEIQNADAVVLPGVGAFADAMGSLWKAGMVEVVKKVVSDNKPFLGICLGLQLLFDHSKEGGTQIEGLKLFQGAVKQFSTDMNLKVPHMGWNSISYDKECPLFKGLPESPYVYFVHSFFLDAADRSIVTARTHYGIDFDSSVAFGNIYATQFHPEKSGEVGLVVLKNFVGLI